MYPGEEETPPRHEDHHQRPEEIDNGPRVEAGLRQKSRSHQDEETGEGRPQDADHLPPPSFPRTRAVQSEGEEGEHRGHVHKTQEEVKDELSDTLSSMRFQAFALSPLISGVVVTMAILIIKILKQMSETIAETSISLPFLSSMGDAGITPFQFVFIVAIYLIETCVILSIFINGIENGEDPVGKQSLIATSLMIGFLAFTITLVITLIVFDPLIVLVIPV